MSKATNWESLPLLLTVPELQEAIGLSRHRAYALASVVGIKIGKRLLVPKDALKAWLDRSAGKVEAAAGEAARDAPGGP